MGRPTKGGYLTRGRGVELEKEIERVRRELGERVAAAEARAKSAEDRVDAIYKALVTTAKRKVA